ncbi:hypothetical protein HYH02_011218 [Chlamydomonas schloesseri]|uniref:Uncharacterized protein n=1 Tax=Chlamydomonas schloesseri TaxID=2026947 RepID=A0A835W513_9CHLO|nr:hypothetical protein HYH02_011218 [Chlamydomonas schloesseri]|eukprot:KAG2437578.1 hypothetical protein HYH02_011218 [Chlamydomonas schloesseri]
MKQKKKQRIVYKQDAASKAAELEDFLFGTKDDPAALFERENEEGEETVAELVKQATRGGGLLHDSDLFFEDTRGDGGSSSDSGDDDDGRRGAPGSDDEEEDEEGADGDHEQAAAVDGKGEGDEEAGSSGEGEEEEDVAAAVKARARSSEGAGTSRGRDKRQAAGAQGSGPGRPGGRVAVWADPDDAALTVDVAKVNRLRKLRKDDKQTTMDGAEYEAALRKQHQALNPRTSWATRKPKQQKKRQGEADEDEEQEDAEEAEVAAEAEALLARAGGLTERRAGGASSRRLPPGQIETTRLKDANQHGPSEAVVQAVQFHPNGQLLLTAGLDKKLRLFTADGLRNPLLQAVHLDDLPVTAAAFAPCASSPGAAAAAADRVVLSGRRPFFYVFDMGAGRVERVLGPAGCGLKSLERFDLSPPSSSAFGSEPLVAFTGDGGSIPLVSLRTRQWVASLRMSGNVRALAFTSDGSELLSTGDDGAVHVWDLRTRRCRLVFADSGNIGDASSLALSADGRWIATGAGSGVVNVYRKAEVEEAAARAASGGLGGGGRVSVAPARELMNLTTNVDSLRFSPDSQMLAMASRMKRDALRLVHLPSLTVFSNWPTGRSPLHYVHSLDFSPHCGLLTVGNAKGRALLYRLHHYQQA